MKDFEQLKILYVQLKNIEIEIEKYINLKEYEEALSKLSYKDLLINKIKTVQKSVKMNDEQKTEIANMKKEVAEISLNNMKILNENKMQVSLILKQEKTINKISKAYDSTIIENGNILDYNE